MNEKPLERLNYYNGMPLQASDFKTEQDYHMRTRRWLNKSLYSAGIARGLEVRAITEGPKKDTPFVAVSPGLALDSEGREIILFDEALVEVCSYSGTDESTVVGNYLVIEYAEEALAYESGGCAVRTPGTSALKSTTKWGGPSRIQAQVKFSWVPFVPQPGSNQIVLARVELKPGCGEVHQIDAGARRYIGAASAATVRQYALEGEREIAFIPIESFPAPKTGEPENRQKVEVVGRIYFHIRGRQPNSVTLYLRAVEFSVLYYTELGRHSHGLTVGTSVPTEGPIYPDVINPDKYKHTHTITNIITDKDNLEDGKHDGAHTLNISWGGGRPAFLQTLSPQYVPVVGSQIPQFSDILPALDLMTNQQNPTVIHKATIGGGSHHHTVTGVRTDYENPFVSDDHIHHVSPTVSMGDAGVSYSAREGGILSYVDDLQVYIGQIYIGSAPNLIKRTLDIQQQLADADRANWADGAGNPKVLGNGSRNHVLAMNGTGAIRLDFLPGMTFAEGEYCIELRLDAKTEAGKRVANGGKILYNLYVE